MCYLIAKDFNKNGCTAFKTAPGRSLSGFVKRLEEEKNNDDIELVVISRPVAYGEYAPYSFVHSEEDFRSAVLSMSRKEV